MAPGVQPEIETFSLDFIHFAFRKMAGFTPLTPKLSHKGPWM